MISPDVMQELLAVRQVLHYLPASPSTEKGWTPQEQHLFWLALAKYPQGPWTTVAEFIGTKSTRQAMTHAQKLRQKFKRWNKRLRSNPSARALMDNVLKAPAPTTATLVPTADVSVSSSITLAAEMQMEPDPALFAAPNMYFPSTSAPMAGVTLDAFRIVDEGKAEDAASFAPHQILPPAQHGLEHLQFPDSQPVPPNVGQLHASGFPMSTAGAFHLPGAGLPPLQFGAGFPALQPYATQVPPSPLPSASPLMTRAMVDDLVHVLMDEDGDDGDEDEDEALEEEE